MMKKEADICSTFLVPLEIETEILSRLPVKSLLRFKGVQKSWRNLIESPPFIMHQDRSGKSFLLYYSRLDYFKRYYRRENNNIVGSESLEIVPSKVKRAVIHLPEVIIGSSNGLICFGCNSFFMNKGRVLCAIRIWNPSTRRIKKLPTCDDGEVGANCSALSLVGFGFCPKLNDYKVVKILCFSIDSGRELRSEFQVYSLSTNTWNEKTAIGNTGWWGISSLPQTGFINGISYWLGFRRQDINIQRNRMLIIAFNFEEETFEEIDLPNDLDFLKLNLSKLLFTEYQGLLCLITSPANANVFDVWVRKECGAGNSWVKQFSVQVPIPIRQLSLRPVIMVNFENKSELLLDKAGTPVWYNTETSQIEEQEELWRVQHVLCCKESLVPLHGGVSAVPLTFY
ncbi:hypothetical protein DITRI_Ditri05aG0132700 [Diplodiscus trichospermus]